MPGSRFLYVKFGSDAIHDGYLIDAGHLKPVSPLRLLRVPTEVKRQAFTNDMVGAGLVLY